MSECPEELQYSKSHEWLRMEEDGSVTVGITDHAQSLLGDLVFIELPDVESDCHAGDEIAVVESVKTASDVYMPLSGKIIAVNEELSDMPGKVNQDPYGDGWLFRMQPADFEEEAKELMTAGDYQAMTCDDEADNEEAMPDEDEA